MIIYDLDVEYIPVLPAKAYPPLIVDADAVLPLAVAFQGLQPVSRWNPKILQASRLVQIQQLTPGDTLDGPEAGHIQIIEQRLGPGIAEGADHSRQTYYVTRNMSNGMVAIVIIFPEIVGHAPIATESGIVEVPVESDPGAGYLLPPEWK